MQNRHTCIATFWYTYQDTTAESPKPSCVRCDKTRKETSPQKLQSFSLLYQDTKRDRTIYDVRSFSHSDKVRMKRSLAGSATEGDRSRVKNMLWPIAFSSALCAQPLSATARRPSNIRRLCFIKRAPCAGFRWVRSSIAPGPPTGWLLVFSIAVLQRDARPCAHCESGIGSL